MRILHVSTRLILGGSQENTVLSCEGQARLGHEVHLAFGPIYGPEGSLLERVERFRTGDGRAIATHTVPSLVREVHPAKDRAAYRELVALIERLKPDIVHTHSSKAGILGRAAAYAVRARARRDPSPRPGIVHTIHGPPFMPVEGGVLARAKGRAVNHAYTLAERFAARRSDVIVSVADAMTRQFLARGIGRAGQYVTVRSGMDVDQFLPDADAAKAAAERSARRAALGVEPGDVVIGTVARLAQHKGHDDLLDALAADLRAQPTWTLLWVGDGWWRERLVAKARGLGLSVRELDRPGVASPPRASVILTGLVPPERVPGLVRAMDVLAHPSYREGLPRTVPQALLAGVAPVAYDVDGTGEVCVDGKTGRLVRAGVLTALRAAVAALASDPAERTRLAAAGQALCREAFSAEGMVAGLEGVYGRALGAGG